MREWDEVYTSGNFRDYWDLPYPSQELVAFVASMDLPSNIAALDVGCGAGSEAIFLAQRGYRVIGVDLSAAALNIARERANKAEVQVDWRQGDALKMPLENRCVDMVNDRGCFHTIAEENRGRYAEEVARVLKPGGVMLLRGCREKAEEGHFVLVTEQSVDQHFSRYFKRGPVLPIQMTVGKGYSEEGMKGNLVVLKRK
ncbi:class I SAM-dependent methyltransferase [Paenibacillus sp. HJGM_3]|uniref:class I SAM-dependent methyltransferase n=1 Tax=Paenibacillus sp. HJGM_3 TaxID=3379816 RepID=UPI00385FD172